MGKLILPEHQINYHCLKATVAANFNKCICDRVKSDPLSKVKKFPTYIDSDDHLNFAILLDESNAVSKIVGGNVLWGETAEEKALIYQWVEFADKEINPQICSWCFPFLSLSSYNELDIEIAQQHIYRSLKVLDDTLLYKAFLVGNHITQADISCTSALYLGFKVVLGVTWQCNFPNVTRWFNTMINQPEFLQELQENCDNSNISLCQETPLFDLQQFSNMKKICQPNEPLVANGTNQKPTLEINKISIKDQIIAQGSIVRQLKSNKAAKEKVNEIFSIFSSKILNIIYRGN